MHLRLTVAASIKANLGGIKETRVIYVIIRPRNNNPEMVTQVGPRIFV
jgi:hypothetical protein